MKSFMVLLVLAGLFFVFGCVQEQPVEQEPEIRYVCSDGTVVLSADECPVTDIEYDACKVKTGSEKDSCFYSLAVQRQNTSLCNEIEANDTDEEYNKIGCAKDVALAKQDPEECKKLSDTNHVDDCYLLYAREIADYSLCDLISRVGTKDACIDLIAADTLNWTLCDKIAGYTTRDRCYYGAGLDTLDFKYCDKITAQDFYLLRVNCYGHVSWYRGDPSGCENLDKQADKDDCYNGYAVNSRDSSGCDYIIDENKKQSCMNSFE